jgi:hypothetical protein
MEKLKNPVSGIPNSPWNFTLGMTVFSMALTMKRASSK